MRNQVKDNLSFFLIVVILFSFTGKATAQKKSKLVVGIVVDQMCYDYIYRYQQHFKKNGFNTFLKKGVNCRNVNYNYVPTFTGPGHASIYTGTSPNNHGIIGNAWFDRQTGTTVNCVEDLSVIGIGTTSSACKASPKNLLTYTITDQLKLSYPSAKVISISIKNRSAILPGGHLSDGSYWFDNVNGTFTTSSYYKNQLPDWLLEFNKTKNANTYLKDWDLLYPIEKYIAGKNDASKYEGLINGKTSPTFPYNLTALPSTDFSNFTISPFANTLLTDLAITAIENEKLGNDSQTDMLCVSYSTPDIAGHVFGPYSLEMEDMYARLDREIAKLMDELNNRFGKDNFTVFLTADHAVVPIPQMLVDMKLPGGYLNMATKKEVLKNALNTQFGKALTIKEINQNIYLNRQEIDSLKLDFNTICQFIVKEIRDWPEVKAVYTAQEFLNNEGNNDKWREMVRLGFDAKRSGDVLFILQPGYLPIHDESERMGTSHGSAFNYDTHVPLMWYGGGLHPKDIFRPLEIVDISATLTHLLFLQRSGAMTGEPIIEVLDNK
jgi:predicted AlkP superfamily pyrophosphatase or phosphodiesterase